MAVKIGHASKDENGKTTGGVAGDQTGNEVKTQSWWDNGWTMVLRARDPAVAEKIAVACEAACLNEKIGYDQSGRNTLNIKAKAVSYDLAKIASACECDCSSLVAVCVRAALGKDYYTGNAPTTGTLKAVLTDTGAFEVLTDSKYLTSDKHLLRGDILLKPGYHTVIALTNGAGGEVTATKFTATYSLSLPLLQRGDSGDTVKALQSLLIGWGCSCGKWGADGDFGSGTENAVEAFQEDNGLTADGKVGSQTWAALLGIT